MGTDKAFLLLSDKPLIQHVIERVLSLSDDLFIIAPLQESYTAFKLPVYPDLIPDRGPLGGIYTALEYSQHDNVLVVACDMPFLNPQLLMHLIHFQHAAQHPYEAVVPRWQNQAQSLHAIYHKSAAPKIYQALQNNQLKLSRLLDDMQVGWVEEADYRHIDPSGQSFINLNTPEDAQRLK